MNLRELTHDQDKILEMVENGDFSLDEVKDHIDMLDEDRKNKIENYLHVINRLDNQASTIANEITRLKELESSKLKALKNIKEWLLLSMKDGEKHEFELFKVTKVKGRDVVSIENEQSIDNKFKTVKQVSTLDKRTLLKALQAGEEVTGAKIKTGNSSLRIK